MANLHEVLGRGWQLHQAGQLSEAQDVYQNVLDQIPDQPEALVYMGILYFDRRAYAASAECYRKALNQRDEFPIAWNNLGNSLRMLGEVDEADRCLEKSLSQDPKYLSAFKNRGTLWVWNGDIEKGLHWYQRGLEIDPNNIELRRNRGVIWLLLGDYENGWPEYRARWLMPGAIRPPVSAPLWNGGSLSGKTIILYPEQGRGDAIHFVRVAKTLSDQGARVVLTCPAGLIPLFSSVAGVDELLPEGSVLPNAHFHASLIDVVDVWHSTQGELPFGSGFIEGGYLSVSDELVKYWKDWIDAQGFQSTKIGINWQGNPEHHADVYRSIPLKHFQPLADLKDVSLINLQFGFGVEQLSDCGFADQVNRLPDHVDRTEGAFTDTVAILKNLDHVVTSDTAIAHLAGACGVPVTMIVGKVPDWRWLMDSATTPWYPSMRIVRQTELGDWNAPMMKAATLVSEASPQN